MAFHFIIIGTRADGEKVVYHHASEDRLDKGFMLTQLYIIKEAIGVPHLGIHKLSTESTSWSSVNEMDSYFKDMIYTDLLHEFIEKMSSEKEVAT